MRNRDTGRFLATEGAACLYGTTPSCKHDPSLLEWRVSSLLLVSTRDRCREKVDEDKRQGIMWLVTGRESVPCGQLHLPLSLMWVVNAVPILRSWAH